VNESCKHYSLSIVATITAGKSCTAQAPGVMERCNGYNRSSKCAMVKCKNGRGGL